MRTKIETTPEDINMSIAVIIMLREGMISHKQFDERTGVPGNAVRALRNVEYAIHMQMQGMKRNMN